MCAPVSFFFNDTATTEIYTLSLHDALPICRLFLEGSSISEESGSLDFQTFLVDMNGLFERFVTQVLRERAQDRKSTRLNSSHANISYAVFCLKKKTSPLANLSLDIQQSTPK